MLKIFFPSDEDFFKLFQSAAEELVKASQQFKLMLSDLNNKELYSKQISHHEHCADKIEELTLAKLHKTFITPFDRYDIHRLVSKLDDSVDYIKRTTQKIVTYEVKSTPLEIVTLGDLCHRSSEIILKAVSSLNSLKNSTEILSLCDAIKPLEGASQHIVLAGVAKLYKEESDFKKLIITKELYEDTKNIIGGCRIVAVIIKDIVLEYS